MQDRPQTVVVTGAGGDVGREYVAALTAHGMNVIATDLGAAVGRCETHRRAPGSLRIVEADVTSDADWDRVVKTALDEFGALNGLVNNAAVYASLIEKRDFFDLTTEHWDDVLRTNVRGVWQGMKAVAKVMSASHSSGSIVNVSSAVARAGSVGFTHYAASKAAVEGLTRSGARELGRHGIRVNALAPGLIDNDSSRAINSNSSHMNSAISQRSLQRPLHSSDIVGAGIFLLSPSSEYITGQTLIVDGGRVFV